MYLTKKALSTKKMELSMKKGTQLQNERFDHLSLFFFGTYVLTQPGQNLHISPNLGPYLQQT